MTVVILRLQGLNAEAGIEDIRRFFHGLHIPEGGVHITGGELGEAFIFFNTQRDGQLAMRNSGQLLKGSSVSLHISSIAEFIDKMESRLRSPVVVPLTASSPGINTNILLHLIAAIQGLQSNNKGNQCPISPAMNQQSPALNEMSNNVNQTVQETERSVIGNQVNAELTQPLRNTPDMAFKEQESNERDTDSCKPGYIRLYGFPESVTKHEVCQFLRGLPVLEVITKVRLNPGWCCLVKLSRFADAQEGLKYSRRTFKEFNVEVRLAHEKMWIDAMEQFKNSSPKIAQSHTFSEQGKIITDIIGTSCKRTAEEQPSTASPKRHCPIPPSPQTELCVIVNNLSKNITKTEIKRIFNCHEIPNYRIKHLLNKWGERTSTAFITFEHAEDYASALNMNGTTIGLKNIEVSSITKEEMLAILSRNRCTKTWRPQPNSNAHLAMTCIYARNFPANVQKTEVRDFFMRFNVGENAIVMLVDSQGNGIGEAIVQFGCEKIARQAQILHGKYFMGAKILLTCITRQQMEKILGTR